MSIIRKKTTMRDEISEYSRKAWITGGIYALIVVVLLILKATFSVLLLIFAGALIALFLTGLGQLIQKKTKWNRGISTVAVYELDESGGRLRYRHAGSSRSSAGILPAIQIDVAR